MWAPRRLDSRGSHYRHRRPAQRRQVHPLQRADQERRARGELSVRDDRAERRRREPARPPARRSSPRSSTPSASCPATVSFVDIAGIVRGASEGEGLGNQFLANIREADAIAQVVRGFTDDDVVHVEGAVNPKNDLETINAELMLADLQTLEKAIPRIEKEVKGKKADACGARGRRRREGRAGARHPALALGPRPRADQRAGAADREAVHLRLQRR